MGKFEFGKSTLFIIRLEVEVSCVLVWDHAHWLGQKQNTQNLHLQTDDKRCRDFAGPLAHSSVAPCSGLSQRKGARLSKLSLSWQIGCAFCRSGFFRAATNTGYSDIQTVIPFSRCGLVLNPCPPCQWACL